MHSSARSRIAAAPKARSNARRRVVLDVPEIERAKAARKAATPVLNGWLRLVEAKIEAGELKYYHLPYAKKVVKYPTANLGYIVPAQQKIGDGIDRRAHGSKLHAGL
jgi:hypothetical protein